MGIFDRFKRREGPTQENANRMRFEQEKQKALESERSSAIRMRARAEARAQARREVGSVGSSGSFGSRLASGLSNASMKAAEFEARGRRNSRKLDAFGDGFGFGGPMGSTARRSGKKTTIRAGGQTTTISSGSGRRSAPRRRLPSYDGFDDRFDSFGSDFGPKRKKRNFDDLDFM